ETLYAEGEQWEELAETLLAIVDRSSETQAKLALLSRIAALYRDKLGQPQRAVKPYERMLALDAGNAEAAQALLPIYRGMEKWARLLAIYEVLLQQSQDKAERLQLLTEIRALCETRLASKGLAFQWCSKSYELAPEDGALCADLERLAEEAGAWQS